MRRSSIAVSMVLTIGIGLGGCGTGSGPDPQDVAPPANETPSPALVEMTLKHADLVDGEADQVVSQCPGCALQMEGSADHTLEVAGYELHFCSDTCRKSFATEPETKIAALEIPDPPLATDAVDPVATP